MSLKKLTYAITHDRKWLWALLIINLLGSFYGFWWYRGQLMASPRWQWPIIPDSPGSTFLLSIWIALVLARIDWRKTGMQVLLAVAVVSNMKYGLWTATVLPEAGIKFGWEFDFIQLSLSHAAMWLEAILFAVYYKPKLGPSIIALLWMYFQDLMDYRVLMTFPLLPYDSEFTFAKVDAVILSTVWGFFLVGQAWLNRLVRNQ